MKRGGGRDRKGAKRGLKLVSEVHFKKYSRRSLRYRCILPYFRMSEQLMLKFLVMLIYY